jgi:hypothetical protein
MVMLSSRFLKFHQNLQKCPKPCIRYLSQLSCQNQRTCYGQNLKNISDNLGQDVGELSCAKLKKQMMYQPVPEAQKWRVALVKDLLELRWNKLEIDVIQDHLDDTDAAIDNLCLR